MTKLNMTFLLTALLSMVGARALAHDIAVANADGVTIYYTWANKTELAVSYRGSNHYSKDYSGNVVIPESVTYNGQTYPVTSIGRGAFYSCSGLTSVTIPKSVTSIEEEAFRGCSGLKSVTIPNSVTSIGRGAFYGTTWFNNQPEGLVYAGKVAYQYKGTMPENTSISLMEGTLGIAGSAFSGCSGLTSVTIPNSVTSIGEGAFYKCSGLTSVTIGNTVTSIGNSAFNGCTGLTSVTIPNSVTSIGNSAFNYCTGLTSVTIGNSVTSIGEDAFWACSGLTSVTIPNSVTEIGSRAFNSCTGLTSVTIGNSVTSIGDGVFSNCYGLTNIVIPNSVTSIGENAFWACSGLTSVTIGNSVTSIGKYAFYGCDGLTSVKLPDNIENLSGAFEWDCKLFCKDNSTTLFSVWIAGRDAFSLEGKSLPKPYVSLSITQTTITAKIVNFYEQYQYYSNQVLKNDCVILTDLFPEQSFDIEIGMSSMDGKRKMSLINRQLSTNGINLNIKNDFGPTFVMAKGSYRKGDASVTSEKFYLNNNLINGDSLMMTGLDPKTSYSFRYEIVVTSDKGTTRTYKTTNYITTSALSLVTLQPKVISSGNVIVGAETNINVDEEKVGFEWRRIDWTSDFPSNTGAAALYDGTMEGNIRNLNTEKLWKVRPYYLSNSGTYYYGDWMGVDPTNTSYFEPTVHTYAKIEVKGNTALIKGYALQGTDGVKVQGFKYWRRVSQASSIDGAEAKARRAPTIPSNAVTVEASGQVMTKELTNLGYDTDYTFVAFITTNKGETFYGEEQSFTTGSDPVGIENIEVSSEEKTVSGAPRYYDLQGHQLNSPVRGINIVKMGDGTTKKIFVK